MTPVTDQAGNLRMMKGYLDTTSTSTTTVTVAQLSRRAYDVYVYADGDNKTYARAAAYTIAGPGITTTTITLTDAANTNFLTTFTQATNSNGNYVKFSINAGGFTLTATPTTPVSGTRRAPVNAVQIRSRRPGESRFHHRGKPCRWHSPARKLDQLQCHHWCAERLRKHGIAGPYGRTRGSDNVHHAWFDQWRRKRYSQRHDGSRYARGQHNTHYYWNERFRHPQHNRDTVRQFRDDSDCDQCQFCRQQSDEDAAETAGVVAKSNWNNAAGATRTTPLALVNETGAATRATMTWTANGTWMTPITDRAGNRRR